MLLQHRVVNGKHHSVLYCASLYEQWSFILDNDIRDSEEETAQFSNNHFCRHPGILLGINHFSILAF